MSSSSAQDQSALIGAGRERSTAIQNLSISSMLRLETKTGSGRTIPSVSNISTRDSRLHTLTSSISALRTTRTQIIQSIFHQDQCGTPITMSRHTFSSPPLIIGIIGRKRPTIRMSLYLSESTLSSKLTLPRRSTTFLTRQPFISFIQDSYQQLLRVSISWELRGTRMW